MGERVRAEVYFSGMVQGVGFRFTTRAIASKFDVTGFVRNLPDGRVELIVEGKKGEVERFIETIEYRMGGYIRHVEKNWGEATGEFSGFEIRF